MRSAAPLLVVVAVGIAGGIAAACTTDYQQGKDDVTYANANGLAGKPPPGTSIEANADSDASGGNSLRCGTPTDGGTCAVSFKTDIIGAFGTANCSVTACHGAAIPVYAPSIDVTNASTTWMNLQAFTTTSGLPYIDPCSTDPAQSAISANVLADPGAKGGVHMPQMGQLAQADIDKINTWVACGAPNN